MSLMNKHTHLMFMHGHNTTTTDSMSHVTDE